MRRAIIVAVVCVSCLSVGGLILGARSNVYRIPALADIESIEVIRFSASVKYDDAVNQGPKTFPIPVSLNEKLLAALQPTTPDNSPSQWVGLGELTIHTKDQTRIQVFLFDVSEGEGAFAAGKLTQVLSQCGLSSKICSAATRTSNHNSSSRHTHHDERTIPNTVFGHVR